MGRFGSAGARRRAREQAEREYEEGRNLRPVEAPPPTLVSALQVLATDVPGVRTVTLGEYREDGKRLSRLMVGVRRAPGSPGDFGALERAVVALVHEALGTSVRIEVVDLDSDVDETMADGSPNPYVVVRRG